VAATDRLSVEYGPVRALDGVGLAFGAGEVVALMGRNGSGKSTLLGQLAGLRRPTRGQVRVQGHVPTDLPARKLIRRVGLVPQDAGMLLYGESVDDECTTADRETGLVPGTTAAMLEAVLPGMPGPSHPRDLSEGQRLALALAVQLVAAPDVVLLDEPTRGLDYTGKHALVGVLDRLAAEGRSVVVSTHDVEFVAACADRVVVLADGDVVADGPTVEVIGASPSFAPQVTKILAPLPVLTLDQVAGVLGRTG
jgi:energy-coupling factor transport system ATP-binding protein